MFPVYQPSGIQVPINVISTSLPEAPHNVFIQATTAQFFEDCSWRWCGDHHERTRIFKDSYGLTRFHSSHLTAWWLGPRWRWIRPRLLLSYIDCRGCTLYCIDRRNPKYSKVQHKWVDQISHTLKHLCSQGSVRGDAKAANVLIDVNGDAHLIFLELIRRARLRESSNSIDGDLQGLESIKRDLKWFPLWLRFWVYTVHHWSL